jgi:hypothetical protein
MLYYGGLASEPGMIAYAALCYCCSAHSCAATAVVALLTLVLLLLLLLCLSLCCDALYAMQLLVQDSVNSFLTELDMLN